MQLQSYLALENGYMHSHQYHFVFCTESNYSTTSLIVIGSFSFPVHYVGIVNNDTMTQIKSGCQFVVHLLRCYQWVYLALLYYSSGKSKQADGDSEQHKLLVKNILQSLGVDAKSWIHILTLPQNKFVEFIYQVS